MRMPEALCYLLNLRGRHCFREIERAEARTAASGFAAEHRRRFSLPDLAEELYAGGGASFLCRYEQSIRRHRAAFPGDTLAGRRVLVIGAGSGADVLHLAQDRGAEHVTGVEIDEALCDFSRRMLGKHGVRNATILCADMASVPALPPASMDLAISMATFEHVADLAGVLRETARVLRRGGMLHGEFSPIWRHYYGSHLGKYLPFPWTHLLFGERTVRRTLERLQRRPQPGPLYHGLNRHTLAQYRRIFLASPLEVVSFDLVTKSPLKKLLHRIPLLHEYVAGGVVVRLRKP
jgi:ubiquinone/menaquinone biosynthesis C-methylase UbiE